MRWLLIKVAVEYKEIRTRVTVVTAGTTVLLYLMGWGWLVVTLRRAVISLQGSQTNFCYCNEIPEAGLLSKDKKRSLFRSQFWRVGGQYWLDSLIDSVFGKFLAAVDGTLLGAGGRGKIILQTQSKRVIQGLCSLKIICPMKGHESYRSYIIAPKDGCPKSLKNPKVLYHPQYHQPEDHTSYHEHSGEEPLVSYGNPSSSSHQGGWG